MAYKPRQDYFSGGSQGTYTPKANPLTDRNYDPSYFTPKDLSKQVAQQEKQRQQDKQNQQKQAKQSAFNKVKSGVVNFGKEAAHDVTNSAKQLSNSIISATSGTSNLKRQNQNVDAVAKSNQQAHDAFKQGKISKDQYTKILKSGGESLGSSQKVTSQIQEGANAKHTVGAGISLASLLVAPEFKAVGAVASKVAPKLAERVIEKTAEKSAKGLATRGAVTGLKTAPSGAAYGVGDSLQKDKSFKESAKTVAEDTLLAGGFGVGGKLAGEGLKSVSGRVLNRAEAKSSQSIAQDVLKNEDIEDILKEGRVVKPEVQDQSSAATMINVDRPNAPKLLEAPKGNAEGEGFSMSNAPDPQKVKLSGRLQKINKDLEKVAQGKSLMHPEEVRALVAERQNIVKIARGEANYEDFYSTGKMKLGGKSKPATRKNGRMKLGKTVEKTQLPTDTVAVLGPDEARSVAQKLATAPSQEAADNIIAEVQSKVNNVKSEAEAQQRVVGNNPVETPKPEVKTPSKPIAGNKTSGVAKSIEAKAIENGLTESFGSLAGFEGRNVKEQASKVADLITTDVERAKNIVRGTDKLPDGISGSMFIDGVERYATKNKDYQLLSDLAKSPLTSETSIHASELRLLQERDPDSVTAKLKELATARKKAVESKIGNVGKARSKLVKDIASNIKTPTKTDWNMFVESIACK